MLPPDLTDVERFALWACVALACVLAALVVVRAKGGARTPWDE